MPLLNVNEKAECLLRQASADPEKQVEYIDLEQGIMISINNEDIIKRDMATNNIPYDQRAKVEVEWEIALESLVVAGRLRQVSRVGNLTLFRVMEGG